MTPGTKLRLLREARGWGPEELAKASVMRPQFILQIEANEVPQVHARTWQKLADILDINVDEFFSEDEIAIVDRSVTEEVPEEFRPLVIFTLRLVFLLGCLALLSLLIALCTGVASLIISHI